ncbi:MAG TPA: DUF5060 domain-containing protein [Opitutaceae bacterium]|nr:DUF5060 domain-containing protein [Opitutaceae bacterium]
MSSKPRRLPWLALIAAATALGAALARASGTPAVAQWDLFELTLPGPAAGNPFVDVQLSATFTHGARTVAVNGFYDGDGTYRIRFMPDETGAWRYATASNAPALAGRTGTVDVTPPGPGDHGPVRVHDTYHFAYADGTPYHELGTTCYSWIHRPEALQEETLRTLAASPFNKLRMCVFPQGHNVRLMPPPLFPFAGTPPQDWDFTRFNPAFFRHLEQRVGQLRDLGIECDLILFHPYDDGLWGFDRMPAAADDRYLRYIVARLAAYRNIWWSLANEFDFMRAKTDADWDRFFQIVQHDDPYGHLRSIHNGARLYNNSLPWVTHASIQNGAAVEDPGRAELYRDVWHKPVVYDEVKYEGSPDAPRWGDLTAPELVHRFWCGTVAGTYVGHSEFFTDQAGAVWLGEGGTLRGESPPRLAFLRRILEAGPPELDPIDQWQDTDLGGVSGEYYLLYFGRAAPASWTFRLPVGRKPWWPRSLAYQPLADGMQFQVDVIDTWAMTITPVPGVFTTKALDRYAFGDRDGRAVALPGKPYLALRIRRVGAAEPAPAPGAH